VEEMRDRGGIVVRNIQLFIHKNRWDW